MKQKRFLTGVLCMLLIAVALSACGTKAPANAIVTPVSNMENAVTPTIDFCAADHIKDGAQAVHRFMRTFDDTAAIASNTGREKLNDPISTLQAVRRQAEDLQVPDCLVSLKNLQLAHMNAVITTLISFVGGSSSDVLNQYIDLARKDRQAYNQELERLIGATLTPAPTMPPLPTQNPLTPVPTEAPADTLSPTETPAS